MKAAKPIHATAPGARSSCAYRIGAIESNGGYVVLYDMHCHLGFLPNAAEIACEATARGEGMLSCGVDPASFAKEKAFETATVRVGLGLHPWWVARSGKAGLASFLEQLPESPYIGEIGLDYGARHKDTFNEQVFVFTQICRALVAHPGKIASIHAVKNVDVVLDILNNTGALATTTCILHWFSGTSQQLTRATRAGCYISLGTLSLSSKRGAAYARQVPAGRILLETDYPPQHAESFSYADMHAPLEKAAEQLAKACGTDVLERASQTSAALLKA